MFLASLSRSFLLDVFIVIACSCSLKAPFAQDLLTSGRGVDFRFYHLWSLFKDFLDFSLALFFSRLRPQKFLAASFIPDTFL